MSSEISRSQGPKTTVPASVHHVHTNDGSLGAHICGHALEADIDTSLGNHAARRAGPIRMLRLAQVRAVTGLGKTKIYELQAEGSFPMRVKLTMHSVAWVEADVQAWLASRIEASAPLVET